LAVVVGETVGVSLDVGVPEGVGETVVVAVLDGVGETVVLTVGVVVAVVEGEAVVVGDGATVGVAVGVGLSVIVGDVVGVFVGAVVALRGACGEGGGVGRAGSSAGSARSPAWRARPVGCARGAARGVGGLVTRCAQASSGSAPCLSRGRGGGPAWPGPLLLRP